MQVAAIKMATASDGHSLVEKHTNIYFNASSQYDR